MIKELYHSKERFERWMNKVEKGGIAELNKAHSDLVITCVKDFLIGINISKNSQKGARSHNRLNHFKDKIIKLLGYLEQRGINDFREVSRAQLHQLFEDMRTGVIKTKYNTPYKSTNDYVKNFKAFWNWYAKVSSNQGKIVQDVISELDTRGEKPKFVYFTEKDCSKIINFVDVDTKVILSLAFDTGARVTELMNIKVSDFEDEFKSLNIRDETSKTFGRKIKIMLCSDVVNEYIKKLNLGKEDFFCRKNPSMVNRSLNQAGKRILKPEQIKYKNLTLYDFRHSSACFWLIRYKSEMALKYRFGWRKSEMIHYYTEFLGMKDTITKDDLYTEVNKGELEKQLDLEKLEREKLQKEIKQIREQNKELMRRVNLISENQIKS